MFRWLLTKRNTKIPLLYVTFNLKLYRKFGKKGSCLTNIHPSLRKDEYIVNTLKNLIDYIRDNYDMEDL